MPTTASLTKVSIIKAVTAASGFTLPKASETVETVLELIKQALESGDDVLISNFGKFCVKEKAARRNGGISTHT